MNFKHRAPLIVTAVLPNDIQAWADGLRSKHYPSDRTRIPAHVTLFHTLPPSIEPELLEFLSHLSKRPPPIAEISGVMKLDNGTAVGVRCPEMLELHSVIADRMHGLLTHQDAQPLRLHITIQSGVTTHQAREVQSLLRSQIRPSKFKFRGLAVHAWEAGHWRFIKNVNFWH